MLTNEVGLFSSRVCIHLKAGERKKHKPDVALNERSFLHQKEVSHTHLKIDQNHEWKRLSTTVRPSERAPKLLSKRSIRAPARPIKSARGISLCALLAYRPRGLGIIRSSERTAQSVIIPLTRSTRARAPGRSNQNFIIIFATEREEENRGRGRGMARVMDTRAEQISERVG